MKKAKKETAAPRDSGRLEDALELLSLEESFERFDKLVNLFQEMQKNILFQMGRFNNLKHEKQLGTLDEQFLHIQENQIKHSMLLSLDEFKKVLPQYIDLSQPELLLRGTKEQETLALEVMKTRLRGHYKVENLMKDGNSALVFKLSDIFTGRKAVAKVLKVPKLNEDIQEEIGKVAGLKHRNLIKLYSEWLNSFPFYVICEYVDGAVLSELISEGHPRPQAQAVEWLCELCDVLQYLNQKEVIHSGIRPSKIFIDYEFHPMLSPFDIIRSSNDNRTLGKFREECQYFSPELMSKEMDLLTRREMKASDQFALGLVAYKMLTGYDLFSGDSIQQVIKSRIDYFQHSAVREEKLSRLPSPAWIELVANALQEKPENRYPDLHILYDKMQEIKAEIRKKQGIVVHCYEQCLKTNASLIDEFYRLLFAKMPALEAHFKGVDIARQRYMFHMTIELLLEPGKPSPALYARLSDPTHRQFTNEQYTLFLDTFVETVQKLHQEYGFTWGKPQKNACSAMRNQAMDLIRSITG
ncbi:MAG: protein kinase [Saprospiraceae bacterium]|nr:protein kinase [Saprospiraceae bacterium]